MKKSSCKIEENSHMVSPMLDNHHSIVCSESRPAGYCHDQVIGITNSDWMKRISNRNVCLSELSLPGTHDTMALYGGDIAQCQSVTLERQLEAGIRVLDIRCRHINDIFAIHHGCVYQNASFGDVLNIVARFLSSHSTETVLMRVQEEYDACNNTRTFEETFRDGYWIPYKEFFWDPNENPNKNPSLTEIEGKIVVLQNFDSVEKYGLRWGDETMSIQDAYHLDTNWDLYDKWEKVKAQLYAANSSTNNTIYINFLSGSGGSFPYFVASGQSSPGTDDPRLLTGLTTPGWNSSYPDFPRVGCFLGICSIAFEGTNILSAEWMGNNKNISTKTGIVMSDFPGKDLIERIIEFNF
ncbi:phosphatidylinositol-specific phospholipase C [Bacteroides uniformis]|uniref:phosphatidylinositol-specific phospholipase C n=2 Tax=Bacteroides uniformis TaxID=820 RepID=UPI001D08C87F|nr:phosphatidylinositol-specific phospholipase C [Bacteroides uniformis]MCB6980516.1 phosphatidylinositol-specific phospholipase C [Bacteroides uniformis]